MKRGYTIRQVKDICAKGSSQVAQKDLGGLTGDYPIYGASGLIKNVDFYHQEKEYIGLVKDGSGIGRVMFLPPKSSVIGTLQYILPKEGYNIRYIGYCLQSLKLGNYKQGAAIPHIYFKDYGEAQILVADNPDEQQRIVSLLDSEFAKIDTLKANAERNLQNAKDLFQAALKKELELKEGWVKVSLSSVCAITSSLVDPCLEEYQHLLHVGGANIISDNGVLVNLKTAKEEELTSGKYCFDDTMVLYNKIRPYLKKVARPDFNGLCSADMYPLKPNGNITKDFLYYILLSDDFTDYAIKGSARAGMPKVNREHLFSYECFIPNTKEQGLISSRLDALSEKCKILQANYEKTLNLCDDLKQALLRKAFNGEIK